jgi:hypothetical protein
MKGRDYYSLGPFIIGFIAIVGSKSCLGGGLKYYSQNAPRDAANRLLGCDLYTG